MPGASNSLRLENDGMTKQETYWAVMDGRAIDDPDDATVMQSYGHNRPSMKTLSKDWGNQLACLMFFDGEHFVFEAVIP